MFHLQAHIDSLHKSDSYQFKLLAENAEEFAAWQIAFRKALAEILALSPNTIPLVPSCAELSREHKGRYTEVKYSLRLEDIFIPFYLLIPDTAPPYPLLMAFHGHAPSVRHILGDYPDEQTRLAAIAEDENFAQRFADEGYMVCAIEQRGFGERITNQPSKSKNQNACRHGCISMYWQNKLK